MGAQSHVTRGVVQSQEGTEMLEMKLYRENCVGHTLSEETRSMWLEGTLG